MQPKRKSGVHTSLLNSTPGLTVVLFTAALRSTKGFIAIRAVSHLHSMSETHVPCIFGADSSPEPPPQAPMVEPCRSAPQHLVLGPVGAGFEACHSMLQHTENCAGVFFGKNIGSKYQSPPCAVICQRWTVL